MATSAHRPSRGLTLEEWESKTQFTDLQRQSVLELQDACAELPLPSGFLDEKSGSPTPYLKVRSPDSISSLSHGKHPLGRLSISPNPRSRSFTNLIAESTAANEAAITEDVVALGIDQPIETTQQFLDWFSKMEGEMEKDQEDVYRNYLAIVTLYRDSCDELLSQIDGTMSLFSELDSNYRFVEERTRALQLACEKLLEEQEQLSTLANSLSTELSYFNELEVITKLFNSPGNNAVLHEDFIKLLARLDECLEYVQSNLKYRDSELYLMRFRQCMTRGMTLIKSYFVSTLKSLGAEVSKKIAIKSSDQTQSSSTQMTLLYIKFRTAAPKLKSLVSEIEQRYPNHREYFSLLNDCYTCYFSIRQQLLTPIVTIRIQELGPNEKDLLSFARNGSIYIMNLCSDEYKLYYNFFSTGEDELYGFLESLLGHLYDYLRPRIIHENRIDILSKLCDIFQMHLKQDIDNSDDLHGLAFSYLIRNVLQDTQQRLVFRAQTYIRNEIQNFTPKPEDLDYPNRLSGARNTDVSPLVQLSSSKSTSSTISHEAPATIPVDQDEPDPKSFRKASDSASLFSVSSSYQQVTSIVDSFEHSKGYFPTLRRTLWILEKLYRCVKTSVFEDLAQEAVSLCRQSLITAGGQIAVQQSKIDSQLFLIKHLVILKKQIAPYDANFVHAGKILDFSAVIDAFNDLAQGKQLIWYPSTLIGLAQKGVPHVMEVRIDSKMEVDRELKRVCEEFIADACEAALKPLESFNVKVSAFRLRNDMKQPNQKMLLREQNFARPDDIVQIFESFQKEIRSRLLFTSGKLAEYLTDRGTEEYLDDKETEEILLKSIQNKIIEKHKEFYTIVQTELDVSTLSKPIMSVEEMWKWMNEIVESRMS